MSIVAEQTLNFIKGLTPTSLPIAGKSIAEGVVQSNALPTTRVEAWKYTRVAKLDKVPFSNTETTIDTISSYQIDANAVTLVFVNGHFSEAHSSLADVDGVSVKTLSNCTAEELNASRLTIEGEVFNAVNTAYLNDGVWISIDAKAQIEKPIQIIHVLKGNASLSNFRTIITAGKFSKASVLQGFFSEDAEKAFTNNVTEVHVADNAHLTLEKMQYEDENCFHIGTEQVYQEQNSTFTINTLTLNGGLVRNNLNIVVDGENCTTNLNGAYLLKEKQHVDNHTTVDHRVPNCNSNELYKGVMDQKSTAVFNGKVFVRKDAQKINAFQSNGNVLLTDDASVNSKPELEIYADDVKCSHGSTTGQLDEEAVFYLRARGLSEKSARQLMVSAFVGEVLEQIENESFRSFTNQLLHERFGWELGE